MNKYNINPNRHHNSSQGEDDDVEEVPDILEVLLQTHGNEFDKFDGLFS